MMTARRTLASYFDPRANGLNLIRLLLATGVIVWHAFPLSGRDIDVWPVRQLLAEVWVDGFFAISGFLILRSWLRDPHVGRYLGARLLRIMPAFWVCLLVTALIFAPVLGGVFGPDNWSYVAKNSALWIFQRDIDGTPSGVPYPGAWNGSLWTLAWEFGCYIAVLALGVVGLVKKRIVSLIVFAVAVAFNIALVLNLLEGFFIESAARFGVMFAAGALLYQYQDRVRVSAAWIIAATAVLSAALFLPDYRMLAALPLAYLLLVLGAALKSPRTQLANDVSYGTYIYAFPVQQSLAIMGIGLASLPLYAILSVLLTMPLAIASWFLVEKPLMRFKGRRGSIAPSSPATASLSSSRDND